MKRLSLFTVLAAMVMIGIATATTSIGAAVVNEESGINLTNAEVVIGTNLAMKDHGVGTNVVKNEEGGRIPENLKANEDYKGNTELLVNDYGRDSHQADSGPPNADVTSV